MFHHANEEIQFLKILRPHFISEFRIYSKMPKFVFSLSSLKHCTRGDSRTFFSRLLVAVINSMHMGVLLTLTIFIYGGMSSYNDSYSHLDSSAFFWCTFSLWELGFYGALVSSPTHSGLLVGIQKYFWIQWHPSYLRSHMHIHFFGIYLQRKGRYTEIFIICCSTLVV